MSRDGVLSSEQALDEYFSALLDEEAEDLELAQEKQNEVVDEVYQHVELVPQLKPQARYDSFEHDQVLESHDLHDIQRLLNQLESHTATDIKSVESIIERNTDDIKVVDEVVTEPVEVSTDEEVAEIEPEIEVQDWDVDTETEIKVDDLAVDLQPEVEEKEEIADKQVDQVVETVDQSVGSSESEKEGTGNGGIGEWHSIQRHSDFQVLYFDVNGVNFAVPLDELGGIHRVETMSHLIGRPKWYLGLQTNRDSQLDVVDTARWVMADKLGSDESYKESYQYIVMLGDSMWGLAACELKGTEQLSTEKVRWREHVGKRPWLAGMVKEKMCALIHVEALIAMLNAGLDVKALDKDY